MNIEQLNKLARTDFSNFIQSENNVKYKIIIPFLRSFNHEDLDLEHAAQGSRIDINIGNRIIVETKALGINLDMHVQQLSNYSGKELPVLSILTNGRHFRIYSPQWRKPTTFPEKVIYDFELSDLSDIQLINRLEKILDFSHFESEKYIENLEDREREIISAKREIDEVKKVKSEQAIELNNEINKLKEQIQEITEQVHIKEKIVADINAHKIPEIEDKIKEYYLPLFKKNSQQKIPIPPPQQNTKNSATDRDQAKSTSSFLSSSSQNTTPSSGNFILDVAEIKATAVASISGFTVKAGSDYRTDEVDSCPRGTKEVREQLIEDGIVKDGKFTQDYTFKSWSAAVCCILGASKAGGEYWKKAYIKIK